MKKQIITLIFILGLISLVSAIYPGESAQVDLSGQMEVYSNYYLIGNTSSLNVSVSGLIVTITIPEDYRPGSFEISFSGYKSGKEVEYVYRSSGGGGTRTVYVDRNLTEYIVLDNCEGICDLNQTDLNQTINQTIDFTIEEEETGFWKRFWNWLKGIFRRK